MINNRASEREKYVVYKNDIKYSKQNQIDPNKAVWQNAKIKSDFEQNNSDTIEYRIEECKNNSFLYLDFSRLNLSSIPLLLNYTYYAHMKKIKFLFLNNNSLSSCIGLDQFDGLEVLDISHNNLIELYNLPPSLHELACHDNKIDFIVTHKNLLRLDCTNNNLVALNKYDKLNILLCTNNKLNNIISYPVLDWLICKNNPVKTISSQSKVTYIDCSDTNIISINIPSITNLICNKTSINEINPNLKLKALEICNTNVATVPYISTLKDLIYNSNINLDERYKIIQTHTDKENHTYVEFE